MTEAFEKWVDKQPFNNRTRYDEILTDEDVHEVLSAFVKELKKRWDENPQKLDWGYDLIDALESIVRDFGLDGEK